MKTSQLTDPCGGDGGGDDVGGGAGGGDDVGSPAGVLQGSTAGSAVGTTSSVAGDLEVHGAARIFLLRRLLLHLLLLLLLAAAAVERDAVRRKPR